MRVLAVAPDATRSGSATTLLDLLRWAGTEHGAEVTTVLLSGGPLVELFGAVGPVHLAPRAIAATQAAAEAVGRSGWGRTGQAVWLRRVLAAHADADVVIAGSVPALDVVARHFRGPAPVVAHLHRIDEVRVDGDLDLGALLADADLTIVPAEPLAAWAIRPVADGGLGLPAARVRHHAGPVAPPPRHLRPAPDGTALVVGCGPVGWTAGTDLFVALADAVGPEVGGRAVHWAWLGGTDDDGTAEDVLDDIAWRGLEGRVHLAGEVADVSDRLAAADLLVVTTREDPYPVAAVEAALVGTPVVGFRPGTALLDDAGHGHRRVDRLDVPALAAQVAELLRQPDRGRLLAGEEARAAAGATTPLAAARLWADIEAVAGRAP